MDNSKVLMTKSSLLKLENEITDLKICANERVFTKFSRC